MPEIAKIFGPPGTGKTTHLLNVVEECLKKGIPPERIAYVSFTRKATQEAAQRAVDRFNLPSDSFKYFRTLHSMCFMGEQYAIGDIMQDEHYSSLCYELGLQMSKFNTELHLPSGALLGDRVMMVEMLARLKDISLEESWKRLNYHDTPFAVCKQYDEGLKRFKSRHGIWDYTDMLEQYRGQLDVDVFILDEAQDLSRLQWNVFWRASQLAKQIYIAGDDDQAIFTWAGADPKLLIEAPGQVNVLPQSYRVPRKIQNMANNIIKNVRDRQSKSWAPRKAEGSVEAVIDINALDLAHGEWLLLSRNRHFLNGFFTVLREKGLLYSDGDRSSFDPKHVKVIKAWETLRKGGHVDRSAWKNLVKVLPEKKDPGKYKDSYNWEALGLSDDMKQKPWFDVLTFSISTRSYYRSLLMHGVKVDDVPKIKVATIHGAKGGQADNVAIITDCWRQSYQDQYSDDERRIKYVAVTRTKSALFLIQPSTLKEYVFK